MTACFTLASVANHLSARSFLRGLKRWFYWALYCQSDFWLVTLPSWPNTQWLPPLWTPWEAPCWQLICNICWHEAAVMSWLQHLGPHFFLARMQAWYPRLNRCSKVSADYVLSAAPAPAMYTLESERISQHQCSLPYLLKWLYTFIHHFIQLASMAHWSLLWNRNLCEHFGVLPTTNKLP